MPQRAPTLVESYRKRLHERVQSLLEEFQVTLDPADLIREVSIFAERSDISEEIVRLRSHLEQFGTIMTGRGQRRPQARISYPGDVSRGQHDRLEMQRRGRRTRSVIEMKTAIERLREMIQNVE